MKKTLLLLLITLNLIFALIVCSPIGYLICVMFFLIYSSIVNQNVDYKSLIYLFKNTKTVFYLLGLAFIFFVFSLFNLKSNLEYAFNNEGELTINTDRGYRKLSYNNLSIEKVYFNESVKINSLKIKRENEGLLHSFENLINPNSLLIFEFNKKNNYTITGYTNKNLKSINANDALNLSNSNFCLNTNFFSTGAEGEVIINYKRYVKMNDKSLSGFLKVIDDQPLVGDKSLFKNRKCVVKYSCQALPAVLKNGEIFKNILHETPPYKNFIKLKTYRNLIGTLKNGNIVCILSNNGGLVSIREIAIIAKVYGVYNASLFDGGSALQYQYQNANFKISFSALNNTINFGERINDFFLRNFKSHFPAKSPVYFAIQHSN